MCSFCDELNIELLTGEVLNTRHQNHRNRFSFLLDDFQDVRCFQKPGVLKRIAHLFLIFNGQYIFRSIAFYIWKFRSAKIKWTWRKKRVFMMKLMKRMNIITKTDNENFNENNEYENVNNRRSWNYALFVRNFRQKSASIRSWKIPLWKEIVLKYSSV